MYVSCSTLVVGMKVFAKKHTELWYKGVIVEVINEDKAKDVSNCKQLSVCSNHPLLKGTCARESLSQGKKI